MTVKFYLGSSPSMALKLGQLADGVMISINTLEFRKSDFKVEDWILDSGAFTRISSGKGHLGLDVYAHLAKRWAKCGNLLAVVSQDYMCEPFIIKKTGLCVLKHQQMTTANYVALAEQLPNTYVMPVLQGWRVADYLNHLKMYDTHLQPQAWVGLGSVCKRNSTPLDILDILTAIKALRPDLRLHGFGLKQLALTNPSIRELLFSVDSFAYSYPKRFKKSKKLSDTQLAANYMQKVDAILQGNNSKQIPPTAGAGNGQGRKPKWRSKTKAIRVPEKYVNDLLKLARQWEQSGR